MTHRILKAEDYPNAALLYSQNCTSRLKHKNIMFDNKVHVAAHQEISLDDKLIPATKAIFVEKGWDSHISTSCPESTKPNAGVATLVKHPGTATEIQHRTADFNEVCKSRRVNITLCTVNACFSFYLCNVYGCTNGHECKPTASRTNSIFIALNRELALLPPLPACIVGDINAETQDIDELTDMLQQGWTDLGRHADWWGANRPKSEPTCRALTTREDPRDATMPSRVPGC